MNTDAVCFEDFSAILLLRQRAQEPAGRRRYCARRCTRLRAFFLPEFQDYFDVAAAVEAAHRAGRGG